MKTEVSLPDLLAIIEIVDEHVDRNFPGVLSRVLAFALECRERLT